MEIDEILSDPAVKKARERIEEKKDFFDRLTRIEELLNSILLELKNLNSAFGKK